MGVIVLHVSQSVYVSVTIVLHILLLFMLVYLFSSNLSNPSTGGGISSDLCRKNSLGTSHSRHGSESEWLAVSSKRLESVKSHSTGLETKSSCGFDCENSPSTGLVYKWGGEFSQSNPQEDLVSSPLECDFTLSSLLEDTAGHSLSLPCLEL